MKAHILIQCVKVQMHSVLVFQTHDQSVVMPLYWQDLCLADSYVTVLAGKCLQTTSKYKQECVYIYVECEHPLYLNNQRNLTE